MHLGSLESTQEARVALGYRLVQLLCIFRALQTSRVHPITRYTHAKHEKILNFATFRAGSLRDGDGKRIRHLTLGQFVKSRRIFLEFNSYPSLDNLHNVAVRNFLT